MMKIIVRIILPISLFMLIQGSIQAEEMNYHRKYALLIGISQYESPIIRPLHYAEKDVDLMRSELINEAYFIPENIRTLKGQAATKMGIQETIDDIANMVETYKGQLADRALFLFYFSGHGTAIVDRRSAEPDKCDEYILPYEAKIDNKWTFIKDDELSQWLGVFSRIQDTDVKTVVILDNCYSGTGNYDKGVIFRDPEGKGMPARTIIGPEDDLASVGLLMSATAGDERAQEDQKLKHGKYTYYFCDALKRQTAVTFRDIHEYVSRRISGQNPQILGSESTEYVKIKDPKWGYVSINSDPSSAMVIIDGGYHEKIFTPIRDMPLTVGDHKIKVVADGYMSKTIDVSVKPGDHNSPYVALERITGTVLGKVIEAKTSEPILEARVMLRWMPEEEQSDKWIPLEDYTDNDGQFAINAPPGKYRFVSVSKKGYVAEFSEEQTIVVDPFSKQKLKTIALVRERQRSANITLAQIPLDSKLKIWIEWNQEYYETEPIPVSSESMAPIDFQRDFQLSLTEENETIEYSETEIPEKETPSGVETSQNIIPIEKTPTTQEVTKQQDKHRRIPILEKSEKSQVIFFALTLLVIIVSLY